MWIFRIICEIAKIFGVSVILYVLFYVDCSKLIKFVELFCLVWYLRFSILEIMIKMGIDE